MSTPKQCPQRRTCVDIYTWVFSEKEVRGNGREREREKGNGRGERGRNGREGRVREVNEGVTVSIGCQLTRGRKGEGETQ